MTDAAAANNFKAIGLALGGYLLWVFSDALMKLSGEASLPPAEVLGFLGLFIMIITASSVAPRAEWDKLWPKNPKLQMARALLPVMCNLANAVALKHLPLTLFYVTVFTAPMMIALLAALLLHEKLTWQKAIAIMVGFVGVVIAINPFSSTGDFNWVGIGAAFLSTVCYALNTVWLRRMTQSSNLISLIFINGLLEAVTGFALSFFSGVVPLSAMLAAILFGMAFFCATGNGLMYRALRMTSAATVAQFHYTQLITGALIGFIIWHDVPGWSTWVGAAIIVGSGIYMAAHARNKLQDQAAPGHEI